MPDSRESGTEERNEPLIQRPEAGEMSQYWMLDPAVTFLNHGSFGACPKAVLEVQQQWRDRMERQPLQFLGRDIETLLDQARAELAAFVGAAPEDLAFIPNATTGVNAVLRSLTFAPGDEVLTTNQEYNACRNALNYVAERYGLTVVVAQVPFPLESPDQVVTAVMQKVSPRTRLALVDHVVSQTGLVFPIAQIVRELAERRVETLVDGAHAPGMVPLALQQLGATYYTGNCHKWLCAPKGAAFLYVQRDRQAAIRPLTISHGANANRYDRSRFWLEFDWMGTDDPTAYLSVPTALQFIASLLPDGWSAVMARNRSLALAARQILCSALDIPPPSPPEMMAALATVPLPDGEPLQLQDALLEHYQIEIPIVPYPTSTSRLVRLSAQLYNTLEQYEYLAEALQTLLPQLHPR
jgi:isopenicillin-N epimerase